MKINGSISKDLNESKFKDLDARIFRWFKQGIYFCTCAAIFYTMQLLIMMNHRFNTRRFRHKLYFLVLFLCIVVIMSLYYTWAISGLILYFGDISKNYDGI
jgi:bacteriorhodopsin